MYDEEKAQRAVNFVKLLRNTQGEYAKQRRMRENTRAIPYYKDDDGR